MTATEPDVRTIEAAPRVPCPRCDRRHRSWYAVAECLWPRAIWISGNPPAGHACYALVAHCHRGPTVTLWASLAGAKEAKADIDKLACGGRCYRHHTITRLGLPGMEPAELLAPEDTRRRVVLVRE